MKLSKKKLEAPQDISSTFGGYETQNALKPLVPGDIVKLAAGDMVPAKKHPI